MRILVTDAGFGVGVLRRVGEDAALLGRDVPAPCVPCARGGLMAFCCRLTRECLCMRCNDRSVVSRMPAVPGVCGMCFSPCQRYLYQLSGEADCVHTRCVATGELLFAAPAGVFPRMMRLGHGGRALLVAGGAVDEAYLLTAPELKRIAAIHTRHPCFAADFWHGGLLLVCATEGEDIQTVVYTFPPRAARPRELIRLPGQPGGLCVCPDGVSALVSTRAGLARLDLLAGTLAWNVPEWALCMRLECRGGMALLSDALCGRVCLMPLGMPWQRRVVFSGTDAQACFLMDVG